jgi:hypothetical protein
MAEPFDRAQRARTRDDEVADLERLDRNVATRRADERACGEADERVCLNNYGVAYKVRKVG